MKVGDVDLIYDHNPNNPDLVLDTGLDPDLDPDKAWFKPDEESEHGNQQPTTTTQLLLG